MPCRDYEQDCGTVYRDSPVQQKKLDIATQVACEALHLLTANTIGGMSKLSQNWWKNHQEQDRRRLADEKARRDREVKKRRALAKLDPEEKKVLGL